VTREDIKRYVKTYINGKPMVTGILLTEEMKTELEFEDAKSYFKP